MIDSRRCPRATGPWAPPPSASGPRDVIAPVIRATAPTSAACPSQRISPQMPHMSPASVGWSLLVGAGGGGDPGIFAAPAGRRVDNSRPAAGYSRQRRRHHVRQHRTAPTGPKMDEGAEVDVMRVYAITVE